MNITSKNPFLPHSKSEIDHNDKDTKLLPVKILNYMNSAICLLYLSSVKLKSRFLT